MDKLGLTRHPEKGVWGAGSTTVECLGVIINTEIMTYSLPMRKVRKMQSLAKSLLAESARNRRRVSEARLATVCGVAASFNLAYPLAAFYSRGLVCDIHRRLPRSRVGNSRLSRAGMRDLQHWRSFVRGIGRPIHDLHPQRAVHSDASDLGYGGTWSTDLEQGSPGDCEGQSLWNATDRQTTISVRELRSVRLLFHGHFASLAHDRDVRNVLLWEDNAAVVAAINKMVSKSPAMMSEVRKLHRILHKLGVHLQAKWISSAVNRYADRLSRTWNVRDVTLTSTRIAENQRRRRHRSTSCSGLESAALVAPHHTHRRASDTHFTGYPPARRSLDQTRTAIFNEEVDNSCRSFLSQRANRLRKMIFEGVLHVTRKGTGSGGESAAQLMCQHIWADITLETRAGQWEKWLAFCEEEAREPLPATSSDIIAYLGYLRLTGHVSPRSWKQYLSAVSMMHIFYGLPSPSRGDPLEDEVIKARIKEEDTQSRERLKLGGLPYSVAYQICLFGVNSNKPVDVRNATIVTLGYCLGAREDTLRHMHLDDVTVDELQIDAKIIHRKGKRKSEPLHLRYMQWVNHGPNNPLKLLRRWLTIRYAYHTSSASRTPGDLWFLPDQPIIMREQSLKTVLRNLVARVRHSPPPGYQYSSHSIRIGTSTTMQILKIQDSRIVRHLGWNSSAYLQTYFDYTHRHCASSEWFFAQFIWHISSFTWRRYAVSTLIFALYNRKLSDVCR